jgi:hypothetical protein
MNRSASLSSLAGRYVKWDCRTDPPGCESIPGLYNIKGLQIRAQVWIEFTFNATQRLATRWSGTAAHWSDPKIFDKLVKYLSGCGPWIPEHCRICLVVNEWDRGRSWQHNLCHIFVFPITSIVPSTLFTFFLFSSNSTVLLSPIYFIILFSHWCLRYWTNFLKKYFSSFFSILY